MIIADALFYVYYLITISFTRFADVPIISSCSFIALGISMNAVVVLDRLNANTHSPYFIWLLLGSFFVQIGLLYLIYRKRAKKVVENFQAKGLIVGIFAGAWAIIFPFAGWLICKYLL